MPLVPGGANLGASTPGQLAPQAPQPGLGTMLAAAAVQVQDPNRSMSDPQDRPRFPARPLRKKTKAPLRGR